MAIQSDEKDAFTGFEPAKFAKWLNLKDFSKVWDAKLQSDLDKFYLLFFNGLQNSEDFTKRSATVEGISHDPLKQWFSWFLGKFSVYLFIFHNKSVRQLEEDLDWSSDLILRRLQEHFRELKIQYKAEKFLEEIYEKNEDYCLRDLLESLGDEELVRKECSQHPVHSSLEFMLYPEWKKILESLKEKEPEVSYKTPKEKKGGAIKNFIVESLLVLIALLIALTFFKFGNKVYNQYLSGKIEIYEPNFFWLDKNLTFKSDKKIVRDLSLSQDELDRLDIKEEKDKPFIQENRSTPESEVFVLSSDTIPKDLKYISSQYSKYEEVDKGGFRDKTYGSRKAYRVIMNSVEAESLGEKLTGVVSKYKVREYGKVKPGQKIPGGVYFNLYVAEKDLEPLLEEVAKIDDSSRLYVSKTHTGSPVGFEKVFIWVKSI